MISSQLIGVSPVPFLDARCDNAWEHITPTDGGRWVLLANDGDGVGNATAVRPKDRTGGGSKFRIERGNEPRPPRPGQGRARVSSSVGKKFGAGAALTAGVPP